MAGLDVGHFAQFLFELDARLALFARHAGRKIAETLLQAGAHVADAGGERALQFGEHRAQRFRLAATGGQGLFG